MRQGNIHWNSEACCALCLEGERMQLKQFHTITLIKGWTDGASIRDYLVSALDKLNYTSCPTKEWNWRSEMLQIHFLVHVPFLCFKQGWKKFQIGIGFLAVNECEPTERWIGMTEKGIYLIVKYAHVYIKKYKYYNNDK